MPYLSGSFLVARPVLKDPNFARSVVLLIQHSEEGAFGLVVNRPGEAKGLPFPVFGGGPCKAPGLMMIHGHADWVEEEGKNEVAPGVYLGDAAALKRIMDGTLEEEMRYRVVSGYAGWGPGQLEGELAGGAWAVVPGSGEVLFDTRVEDLWHLLLPPALPQPSLN